MNNSDTKSIRAFKAIIFLALGAIFINILILLLGPYKDIPGVMILGIAFLVECIVLGVYYKGNVEAAKIISFININLLILAISFHLGLSSGAPFYFFPFIISLFYLFQSGGNPRKVFTYFGFTTLVMLMVVFYCPMRPPGLVLSVETINIIRSLSFVISFLLTAYIFYAIITLQHEMYQKLVIKERDQKIDVMRSVINSQEEERGLLVEEMQNNVYQSLASSKLMLQYMHDQDKENIFLEKSLALTNEAMSQVYSICYNLNPSTIRDIGLEEGLKEYIGNYQSGIPIDVSVSGNLSHVEQLPLKDKLSLFRIIQDFLMIHASNSETKKIDIHFDFLKPVLFLQFFQNDAAFSLSKVKEQFLVNDFRNRVDYFKGESFESMNLSGMETLLRLNVY